MLWTFNYPLCSKGLTLASRNPSQLATDFPTRLKAKERKDRWLLLHFTNCLESEAFKWMMRRKYCFLIFAFLFCRMGKWMNSSLLSSHFLDNLTFPLHSLYVVIQLHVRSACISGERRLYYLLYLFWNWFWCGSLAHWTARTLMNSTIHFETHSLMLKLHFVL